MNKQWVLLLVIVAMLVGAVLYTQKESFAQGYDYVVAGCVKQCELDYLRRNPFFVQLQDGGIVTQNHCRKLCLAEYNKHF